MAQLHEDGYQFIGPASVNKLTMPEIRVLKEGQLQNQREKKRKQRARDKSGSDGASEARMDIEESHDQSDKSLVEDMASN